jgi:hypothetical protein
MRRLWCGARRGRAGLRCSRLRRRSRERCSRACHRGGRARQRCLGRGVGNGGGRRYRARAHCLGGRNSRGLTFQREDSRGFPAGAYKDLHLIRAWAPGLRVLPPIGNADTRWGIPPGSGIDVLEAAIVIPQRAPLYLHPERLIVEDRVHLLDGVMETGGRCNQLIVVDDR